MLGGMVATFERFFPLVDIILRGTFLHTYVELFLVNLMIIKGPRADSIEFKQKYDKDVEKYAVYFIIFTRYHRVTANV